LQLTYSVLFIVPVQIYKERVDVNKITRSNLKVVKGMMNKTELAFAPPGGFAIHANSKSINKNPRHLLQ